jgi:hypothetical protein
MDEREIMEMRSRIIALEARVEYLYQHLGISFVPSQAFTDARLQKVYDALMNKDYLGAVRIHREQFNSSLEEAKRAVDGLKANMSK